MTADDSPNSPYSGFSWAVLADTGWYGVDLENGDPFSVGKN